MTQLTVFPALLSLSGLAAWLLLCAGVPVRLVSTAVLLPLVALVGLLERRWPERADFARPGEPVRRELCRIAFHWLAGYGLALAATRAVRAAIQAAGGADVWPHAWPLPAQVLAACVVAEGVSYWQHRWFHRAGALWRFHLMHHVGGDLNVLRGGRFHLLDIGLASLFTYLPVVALGASELVVAWLAIANGAMGVLQHANLAMPTPRWLSWLICTPAVHRHHHSLEARESDANFGTLVMIFDVLLGTYAAPVAGGPLAVGAAGGRLPGSFAEELYPPT